jgi:hypothetical protein
MQMKQWMEQYLPAEIRVFHMQEIVFKKKFQMFFIFNGVIYFADLDVPSETK